MQTIAQAFQEFLQSLELTPAQRTAANDQHTYMRTQLQKRLDVEDNFLSGSYARRTAVRPLNDIDIFLVLDRNSYPGFQPRDMIGVVQDVLEKEIYDGKVSNPQPRSVNIEFSGTGIAYDVVPAFRVSEDIYEIPDTEASKWIRTNPKEHARLSTEANARAGGKLKPLLKAVKHAKNFHGASARSFHLEVLSWSILTSEPTTYLEGLDTLLTGLATRICDPCPDPAGLGPQIQPSVAKCLEARGWLEKMAHLARDARRLADDGKVGEAHAKLREAFGGPQWPEKGAPESERVTTAIVGSGAVDHSGSRFG